MCTGVDFSLRSIHFPWLERLGENSGLVDEFFHLADRIAVDDSVDPDLISGGRNELDEEVFG
jgi:hypothetical protein